MLDLNNHNHNPNKTTTKKKRVPDWLNASIWYSPPPLPHSDSDFDFDFDIHGYPTAPPQPQPQPPPTPPPPPPPPSTRTNNPSSHTDYPSTSESPSLSPDDIARHSHLLVEMSKKVINMKEVRRLASFSLPDAPSSSSLRSSLWKLLLGYLPPERTLWPLHLTNKRTQYKQLKDDLFLTPSEITRRLHKFDSPIHPLDHKGATRHPLPRSHIPPSEHPLTLIQSSVWHKFFQDAEILEQIDRDVKRTHPDIQFFSGDTSLAKSTQDAMRNILIVFAKLNPGIRYVQGMNEILAPLFYVFCNDPDDTNAAAAEADTFFCFSELLSGFRDNFCQQLDNSVVGIRSTIMKLSLLLKEHDEELWRHLEVTCKINPEFYGFRWITLLLTQEFSFTDILHIWDALLSDPEAPQETLLRICCAMLILVRRRLLAGDFTSNLKLLQHYPSTTNITHLLYVAHKLRAHPSS